MYVHLIYFVVVPPKFKSWIHAEELRARLWGLGVSNNYGYAIDRRIGY